MSCWKTTGSKRTRSRQEAKINREVNQPSSKKPEWDKDGNPKPPTKSKNRKKKKDKRRREVGTRAKIILYLKELITTLLIIAQNAGWI